MIVISLQNIESIMAKEGLWSPVERVAMGHWSPSLASSEVSDRGARFICYLDYLCRVSVAARNLEKTRQQENDFPVQGFLFFVFLFSFFFSAEKFKTPASGSGNIIRLQTG